jgi:hypothetical protein
MRGQSSRAALADAFEARPLLLGPKNTEAMAGVSWRWLKDHAPALGLTILRVDSKPFVVADDALAAIRRHGVAEVPANDDECDSEPTIADLRARLGLQKRSGGK